MQTRCGLLETPLAHQHIHRQMVALGLEFLRELASHPTERLETALVVAALVPDLGEVVPGAVADRCRHVGCQQALETRRRLVVHAELQVEAPGLHQRVMLVVRHAAPLLVGLETRQRLELLTTIDMEHHVTVVQILHADLRQLGRWPLAVQRAAAERHGDDAQQTARERTAT